MQLELMRHAKSSWAEPDVDDHERPLNERGRRAAATVGRYLAERGAFPERVLCSSARRTQETWERLAHHLPVAGREVELEIEHGLYLASPSALLERLCALPDDCERVLVIGHNPGIAALALALAGSGPGVDLASLRTKVPTASLASFAVPAPWRALSAGRGRLLRFLRPKDLA